MALKTRSVHLHVLDTHMEGREQGLRTERGYPRMPDHVRLSWLDGYGPHMVGVTCNHTFGAQNAFDMAALVKRCLSG